MFTVTWSALRPEKEIDEIRLALAAEFSNDFEAAWREDEIRYQVVDDNNFDDAGEYAPIIRATFSFVAVCNMDLADVDGYADYYRKLLHRYYVDDVGISYKPDRSHDVESWRTVVF